MTSGLVSIDGSYRLVTIALGDPGIGRFDRLVFVAGQFGPTLDDSSDER